jgi:hypothetical protein
MKGSQTILAIAQDGKGSEVLGRRESCYHALVKMVPCLQGTDQAADTYSGKGK